MADLREHERRNNGENAQARRGETHRRPVELRSRVGQEAAETTGNTRF